MNSKTGGLVIFGFIALLSIILSFRIWKTWEERIFYIFLFITTYGMLYLVLFLGPEISEWVNTLKSKMELNSTEENLLGFGVLILALFNLFYVFRMAWKNISEG